MSRTTVRAKGQITLPDDVRRAAHLEEGDLLEDRDHGGRNLLPPQKVIDATQAWSLGAWLAVGEPRPMPTVPAGRAEHRQFRAELFEHAYATARSQRTTKKP